MWHTGKDEAQIGIMISGRNIHNLRYKDDTTLRAESEEELRSLLMKLKEEPEKAGFKLNLQKTKIMAPVRSFHGKQWEKQWKQCETVFSGGSKITADGDYHHESKRRLLLGRKAMTDLGSILKSRNITLLTKVHLVKVILFPVVMYGCESWTMKKAECWRIHAFELWYWRRLLRVPCTARRSHHSILMEISPQYSLEGHGEADVLILWPPDVKNWPTEKDPYAGKDWRWEEKGTTEGEMGDGCMASLTRWIWVSAGSGS